MSRRADALHRAAVRHEPPVTRLLRHLARENGGQMAGLEHRFKTRASLIRKLRLKLYRDPRSSAASVAIHDALRYTMLLADQPAGRHVAGIRAVFAAIEARRHAVVEVKNYWPRGDNYSGVNCVLRAPSGFTWELQFHTPGSFAAQKATRSRYNELRKVSTAVARKRQLYREMAGAYEALPIPLKILVPKSLHPHERIIQIPRP